MRKIDIETCEWMGPRWRQLIQDGYKTELVSDDRIAVMTRGLAARDLARNTDYVARYMESLGVHHG